MYEWVGSGSRKAGKQPFEVACFTQDTFGKLIICLSKSDRLALSQTTREVEYERICCKTWVVHTRIA